MSIKYSRDVAMINKCLIHVVGFVESITTIVNNKEHAKPCLGMGFVGWAGLLRGGIGLTLPYSLIHQGLIGV